ncbi:MAG TPA: glycosyltransferase family 4 protein [Gemmatimonadales bacterium]|nr:glycosyltransferase family 4 protein [Gemmatimonadales bacterium]
MFLAWALTGWVRRYALRRSVLDMPNPRSLHEQPVPRGGGLAVAIVILGGITIGWLAGWVAGRTALALVAGGGAVAGIGWIDDRRGVAPGIKAAVQCLAAVWALAWLGGFPHLGWGGGAIPLGALGWFVGTVGIMWGINFYNFMDGIDGLAGAEAVAVSLAALLLGAAAGSELLLVCALIGGSSAGFLVWNWPPARIFLGDVGSAFLGFMFSVLAVMSENTGALPVVGWLLLLGVFFVDATITVARRIASGQPWYRAHRTHAYQRAVQSGYSHRQVTLAIMGLNVVLAGLAWVGWTRPARMPAMAGLGILLLAVVYWLVERRSPMWKAAS